VKTIHELTRDKANTASFREQDDNLFGGGCKRFCNGKLKGEGGELKRGETRGRKTGVEV